MEGGDFSIREEPPLEFEAVVVPDVSVNDVTAAFPTLGAAVAVSTADAPVAAVVVAAQPETKRRRTTQAEFEMGDVRRKQRLFSKHSARGIDIDSTGTLVSTKLDGWRMARAAYGVSKRAISCFFEARIERGAIEGATPHARVGWASLAGNAEGNVGMDEHSYGYRDLDGSAVHKARVRQFGEPWGIGDVVGCAIRGAEILFYKNGKCEGVAFRDVPENTWFPAVSVFGGAVVKVNFGPNFEFPPQPQQHAEPFEWTPASALLTVEDVVAAPAAVPALQPAAPSVLSPPPPLEMTVQIPEAQAVPNTATAPL